jgi:serine/threonine protein kinase
VYWLKPGDEVWRSDGSESARRAAFLWDDGSLWGLSVGVPGSPSRENSAWNYNARGWANEEGLGVLSASQRSSLEETLRRRLEQPPGSVREKHGPLLDHVADASLTEKNHISGKKLRHTYKQAGPGVTDQALALLSPRYIDRADGDHGDIYRATFAGLLVSAQTSRVSHFLETLLHHFRRLLNEDPDFSRYSWDELRQAAQLSEFELTFAVNVIRTAGWLNGGSDTEWGTPRDIEALVGCPTLPDYLNYLRRGTSGRPWPTAPARLLGDETPSTMRTARVGEVAQSPEPTVDHDPTQRTRVVAKSWQDHFKLDEPPIGDGGQAQVFRATHRTTGEVVALKRVRNPRDEHALTRMRHEIEIQSSIKHPQVMPVLHQSEALDWYTMPISSRVLLSGPPKLHPDLLREIVLACARALIAGHNLKRYHRDVSPGNLFHIGAGDDGRWVLGDWGLVRRAGQTTAVQTRAGSQFGTAGFAAPEIWRDAHAVDHRADIYSLGRVVAWAVTGTIPEQNVYLPADGPWQAFVERSTQHDPAGRPDSVEELLTFAPSSGAPIASPIAAGDDATELRQRQLSRLRAEQEVKAVLLPAGGSVSGDKMKWSIRLENHGLQPFIPEDGVFACSLDEEGLKWIKDRHSGAELPTLLFERTIPLSHRSPLRPESPPLEISVNLDAAAVRRLLEKAGVHAAQQFSRAHIGGEVSVRCRGIEAGQHTATLLLKPGAV